MIPDKITQITRYHGPGLPLEGVETAEKAYELGLVHARAEALRREWMLQNETTAREIAIDYDALVRVVAAATDRFIDDNGILFGMVEREARLGQAEQPEDVQERIREREMDKDHADQVAENLGALADKYGVERPAGDWQKHDPRDEVAKVWIPLTEAKEKLRELERRTLAAINAEDDGE